MTLVAEIRHRQYGSAVFSRPNLKIEEICAHTTKGHMETITVALPNVSVTLVYKPPSSPFLHTKLPERCKRKFHISIGDFNAHSTLWGYECRDNRLCFHSFHRSVLQATTVPFCRRFNLRKADWLSFQQGIEHSISSIPPHPNNYTNFIELVKRSARRHIPKGCQTEYIPGLSETSSDRLTAYYKEYNKGALSPTTMELGETLINGVGEEQRKIWKEMIENTNMTNNSRKAWATIRHLGKDQTTHNGHSKLSHHSWPTVIVKTATDPQENTAKQCY
ncbi:hypothetical protein SKAU_G00138660 [Synaphobranchus kaupii]|uniref:Endonuclease/exonuclease/phosphatase domain-containing protein n=1 Tax=Synaphobranchus kaupii TaxID=118154 RepID=A0A9Q1FRT8_SYNKA|nr:hypothetical protein SKAU_G00138660 [Synaphobranchus kaupii]